ncbi:precorrin-2 dehydrogenase/sirohydrochlorin ferrochelatase family protein [Saccharibacillus alkalitolerans]|uniref:precorrin-2 dehydrogenase n=1 Tax=Saccharibacillus alkalitolerans TaxID=2705290 RepID=A0ABX0FEB5_9BACL|nr:NAD(P)-dependent oxidoreductase [Saccharibacillus alkalitolerans]NGZ77532.1 bifunctional precorrin-2 dehydrogenase/sirohydrochlorin ferrochelatase [Saccharibacillus alkalitolerans]
MTEYMPIMLDVRDMRVLVVGGGRIAGRKARQLAEAGADITLISPEAEPEIRELEAAGTLRWLRREASEEDVDGYRIVYAASGDETLNERIAEAARRQGALVNAASRAQAGNFIHPAVLRRGRLIVTASTSGAGPSAASALIRELDERFGDEYETYAEFLYFMRKKVRETVIEPETRHRLMRKLAETDILDQIRQDTFVPWSETEAAAWIEREREE